MSLYPTPKNKRRPNTSAPVSRPELTEEQRQEVKEAFELFDTDKDGVSCYRSLPFAHYWSIPCLYESSAAGQLLPLYVSLVLTDQKS